MLHFDGVHPIFLKIDYERCLVLISEQFLMISKQFLNGSLPFSCKPFNNSFLEISLQKVDILIKNNLSNPVRKNLAKPLIVQDTTFGLDTTMDNAPCM